MDGTTLVIFLVIVFGIAAAWSIIKMQDERKSLDKDLEDSRQLLENLGGPGTDGISGRDGAMLAQALDGRTWLIPQKGAEPELLTSENLIGAEVVIDGATVTKAQRGRQIGAAAIGGLLAGGPGAIIGALGAQQISTTGSSKVSLILKTTNIQRPMVEITIWDSPGSPASVEISNRFRTMVQEWCVRMEIVMRSQTAEDQAPEDKAKQIARWASLLEAGHISQDEFDLQKKEILG